MTPNARQPQASRPEAGVEHEQLRAAQSGDREAFETLVAPFRHELAGHCYRMLGSAHDAEDVVQEVLLRAWRAIPNFEARSSVRTWLHHIASNCCRTALQTRSRRVLPLDLRDPYAASTSPGQVPQEVAWIEPWPGDGGSTRSDASSPATRYETHESLELAFVALLQYLPPNQRAALVLRDVLGFSAKDAASAMGTTPTSLDSALQHGRRTIGRRVPSRSQLEVQASLGDRQLHRIVRQYIRAFEEADVEAMLALLARDATWSMPPMRQSFRGDEEIRKFLTDGPMTQQWRHVVTRANSQPAVGCYVWDSTESYFAAAVIDVLELAEHGIQSVTAFADPGLFSLFGLPDGLGASTPPTA